MGTFRNGTLNRRRQPRRTRLLPTESERRLEQQRDVIAHWQLANDGLDRRAVDAVIDAGVLRPLPGRILTTARAPLQRDARRWAALLSGGAAARLTSVSVLELAGIRQDEPDLFHVLVPGSAARPCAGVRRHRSSHLPQQEVARWNGYPGTSIARALVDAAADSTVEELADDLDRAVMLGLYDATALDAARAARPRVPGSQRLTAAIATLDENSGQFRSVFERRTLRLMQTSTILPPALVNVLAHGFRPDLHCIGTHAIIECDGRDYHRSPAQILADDARERILRAIGYVFLRLRWSQVTYEPERTLARIEQFVLAHTGPPVPGALPEPTTLSV